MINADFRSLHWSLRISHGYCVLKSNTEVANKIIFEVAKLIEKERPKSKSHFSLKDGLITQKENIPSSTLEKLRIFTDSY